MIRCRSPHLPPDAPRHCPRWTRRLWQDRRPADGLRDNANGACTRGAQLEGAVQRDGAASATRPAAGTKGHGKCLIAVTVG